MEGGDSFVNIMASVGDNRVSGYPPEKIFWTARPEGGRNQ